jgi:hypothetical protein
MQYENDIKKEARRGYIEIAEGECESETSVIGG